MGLSFGEFLVIIIVAFLFLGPDKLPEAGRVLGRTVNDFKKALSSSELNLKEEVDEIKKSTGISDAEGLLDNTEKQFKNDLNELKKDLHLSDKKNKR